MPRNEIVAFRSGQGPTSTGSAIVGQRERRRRSLDGLSRDQVLVAGAGCRSSAAYAVPTAPANATSPTTPNPAA